jgi:3',5'-nucleoside bisphosphate phosphatase
MIDLHTHSTFSDGSLTPNELVLGAKKAGLTAIALTDHDTTGGIDLFMKACRRHGINGIPGVEMSADTTRGTMHVLGYFIDRRDKRLQGVLAEIRDGRVRRNAEIIERLNGLGLALEWSDVQAFACEDVVGRLHFAQALEAKGYVKSKDKAFDLYLAKGKPGYAERFRLPAVECVGTIVRAGGIAVLAHPLTLGLDEKALRDCVGELTAAGLKGIEAYYSEHKAQQTLLYENLAKEFGLVATGGSDFHGKGNPKVALGKGFGNLKVPDSVVEELGRIRPQTAQCSA